MNSKTMSQYILPAPCSKDANGYTALNEYEYNDPDHVLSGLVEQVNNIHDINQLKQMVIEKEKELHLAATIGFSIAKKNEDLEQKIRNHLPCSHLISDELELEKLLLSKLTETQEISHKLHESEDTVRTLSKSNRDMHRELNSLKEDFQQFRTEIDGIIGEMGTMKHHMSDTKSNSAAINKRIDYIEQDLELTKETVVNFHEEVGHAMDYQQQQTQELSNRLKIVQEQILKAHDDFSTNIISLDERQSYLENKMCSLFDDYKLLLDDAQSTIHSLSESRLESALPDRCEEALVSVERHREAQETPTRARTSASMATHTPVASASRLSIGRKFTSPLDGLKNLVATKGLGEVAQISTDDCEEAPAVLHSYTVL
ncbi:hypothetical protein K493DRAFT_407282 [Basidiobolus meristosporus CBS 931.73]|uniref:Uncharacterized protein n=1 Tax=Basidiobolus meristosporus CBS 931.73 TaxID=1314790 RepID=A0A1Y1VZH1_9FUNG|nr:hypothetical protein K493DRAFT_309386 [Basidiobolus meristosporus CBS 931.73]ORX96241.1 hypothetical protein K493DRAFT_407282 [Basidiobolus meristosporus CBS 931.73]|eukprot:ORX66677.1 hypothetical protein K493DRAFT_309386 [Basidiobolus meristosporus CBS 931.73]